MHVCSGSLYGFITCIFIIIITCITCNHNQDRVTFRIHYFFVLLIDHNRFLSLLTEEATKQDSDRVIVSLHLILNRGHSPLSSSRPKFTNSVTENILKPAGININGVTSGYMDRFVQYIHRNKL